MLEELSQDILKEFNPKIYYWSNLGYETTIKHWQFNYASKIEEWNLSDIKIQKITKSLICRRKNINKVRYFVLGEEFSNIKEAVDNAIFQLLKYF